MSSVSSVIRVIRVIRLIRLIRDRVIRVIRTCLLLAALCCLRSSRNFLCCFLDKPLSSALGPEGVEVVELAEGG